MRERGWTMKEDASRGWRRVVPSPDPLRIWEEDAIVTLVDAGAIVIASGGGGVPACLDQGRLVGCEAVIDKDLAGARLTMAVGADRFCILTDVDAVYLCYKQPDQVRLERIFTAEIRRFQEEGHFKPGSMEPKVEAVCRFAEESGRWGVIASLTQALEAVEGHAGTVITPPFESAGREAAAARSEHVRSHKGWSEGPRFSDRARVAARKFGAASIAETLRKYPEIGMLLPAMGYGEKQMGDLEATINACDCDLVVSATPIDITRIIRPHKPVLRVRYELQEIGKPTLPAIIRRRLPTPTHL